MAAIALRREGSVSSSGGSASDSEDGRGGGGLGSPGIYGPTLTSLQFQPHGGQRRQSFLRNESQGSNLGYNDDDLSLLGECDVSSTRSRENRPGRRASLSAAIQLTRSPPKRNHSGRGRRNSLFGNNAGKKEERDNSTDEALARLSVKNSIAAGGSRRASMAGYPPTIDIATPAEPEPTPQFFHSRKKGSHNNKDKDGNRSVPNRKKSASFDKNDPRAKSIALSLSKIKRPGKGGNRRASMSAVPHRLPRQKSNSSMKSGNSQSNSDEYSTYSDDDDVYNYNSASHHHRVTPPRSASYGMERSKEAAMADLGYGDPDLGYDPQLPPPPPPAPVSKRAFQNRRGSTGTAVPGFQSHLMAQKSLKESLQWKQQQFQQVQKQQNSHNNYHHLVQHPPVASNNMRLNRRGSTSSSIANSVATDIASNVHGYNNSRIKRSSAASQQSLLDDVSPTSPERRISDPDQTDGNIYYGRPQQMDEPKMHSMLGTPTVSIDGDSNHSNNPLNITSTHSHLETPVQSNRKTRDALEISRLSMVGNASTLGAMMGPMNDYSDSERDSERYNVDTPTVTPSGTPTGEKRRVSRGLSMLQKPPPPFCGGGNNNNNSSQRSSLPASGARSSVLGFNPYGSNLRDDDDDEEEEEDLLDEENYDAAAEHPTTDNNKSEDENTKDDEHNHTATTTTTTTTTTTNSITKGSNTDETQPSLALTAATIATAASTEDSFSMGQHKKTDDKDDEGSDHDSMTSKDPREKAPGLKQPDNNINAETVDDLLEEIGATGDWSQGVGDHMIKPKTRSSAGKNSLLDRYPGSDYDEADLGYGPTHKAMNAFDDESERKDGEPDFEFENGYGPSDLYDEDYSSFGWREHRPRAAESMEFIDMEQLMSKAKNSKGLYLPTFIPAHGCTNASDFIVRCFVARLRAGVTVTKHSRSRFCKSHDRILHILPTGYHITWIPDTEEEVVAKKGKPPTKLDLTKCLEVRHAWSRDPKAMKYTGTSTLRSKCKDGAASRSFALIYPHRTVDFTAVSVDQCKILMEGFSALCFRLQMAKLEQQNDNDDETQHTAMSRIDGDDDSDTASLTGTSLSAPWGL